MGTLKRPANLARQAGLAETVDVSLVEVCEVDAPPGTAPILWRRLTTHGVEDAAMARRVVGPFSGIFNALPGNGYRQRQAISSNSSAP